MVESRDVANGGPTRSEVHDEREEFARLMGEYFAKSIRIAIDEAVNKVCAELTAEINATFEGGDGDRVVSLRSVMRMKEPR